MDPTAPLVDVVHNAHLYLLASAFAVARIFGLLVVMPLFSRVRLTGLLRNGLAFAFAVPLIPMIVDSIVQSEITATLVMIYTIKELAIGATVGLLLGVPLWAAEAAGEILDLQRGSTMGTLIDPMLTHETSPTGTLLAVVSVTLFVLAGGLQLTLDSVYGSYGMWPINQFFPIFSSDAARIFLGLLDRTLSMALTLIFPLIMTLLFSDIVLGFIARSAPHLNVFSLSLVVKTLVFSLVFVLYASFLLFNMRGDLSSLFGTVEKLKIVSCLECR